MEAINFYSYNGAPNKVSKELGTPTEMQGDIRQTFDILRPTVTIRTKTKPNFNYCFIPSFNRYYFIERISFEGNNSYELGLLVDVLHTYRNKIFDVTGNIVKRDNSDKYVSNRNNVFSRKPNFQKVEFENKNLLSETGEMVMITIKGNK